NHVPDIVKYHGNLCVQDKPQSTHNPTHFGMSMLFAAQFKDMPPLTIVRSDNDLSGKTERKHVPCLFRSRFCRDSFHISKISRRGHTSEITLRRLVKCRIVVMK